MTFQQQVPLLFHPLAALLNICKESFREFVEMLQQMIKVQYRSSLWKSIFDPVSKPGRPITNKDHLLLVDRIVFNERFHLFTKSFMGAHLSKILRVRDHSLFSFRMQTIRGLEQPTYLHFFPALPAG